MSRRQVVKEKKEKMKKVKQENEKAAGNKTDRPGHSFASPVE